MADDKSKTNDADRKRVAADQGYEVSYFARKHGISSKDARTLIERFGNDRSKLNAEAEKMAKSSPSPRRGNSTRPAQSSNADERTQPTRKGRTKRTSTAARAAALGGVVAAGALLWSRRSQVADQISTLSDKIKDLRAGSEEGEFATEATVEEPTASRSRRSSSGRSQVEIAEEALTLKELGRTPPE